MVGFRVCGVPWANDLANVGSVDFFFTYGGYGFSLKGVVPFLGNDKNLRTKLCCFALGKWNV